ncbi:MAG TPA: hypothetical protein VGU64_15085, partial [Terriglobales bacterium]|nr:hypothetical protein [Terriglobales bacterium]
MVAIDGKTARRSHDRGKGKKELHLVSAWALEAAAKRALPCRSQPTSWRSSRMVSGGWSWQRSPI